MKKVPVSSTSRQMKKPIGKHHIIHLSYYRIEEDFFEVEAITDEDKIAIEGNVCIGILKHLMAEVKMNKGKIVRLGKPFIMNELRSDIKAHKSFVTQQGIILNKIKKLAESANNLSYPK